MHLKIKIKWDLKYHLYRILQNAAYIPTKVLTAQKTVILTMLRVLQ